MKIAVLTGYFPPKRTMTYSLTEMEAFEAMGMKVFIFPRVAHHVCMRDGIPTLPISHLKQSTIIDLPECFTSIESASKLIDAITSQEISEIDTIINAEPALQEHAAQIADVAAYARFNPERFMAALELLNQCSTSPDISPLMQGKHRMLFLQGLLIGYETAKMGIKVIYAQNAAKAGFSAQVANLFAGTYSIWVVQGHNNDTTILSLSERMQRLSADLVTVDSHGAKRPYLEAIEEQKSRQQLSDSEAIFLSKKIHVIHRGIQLSRFIPSTVPAYRDGSNPIEPIHLITIARPIEKKGIHYLIDALHILKNTTDLNILLTYIGDDPLQPSRLETLKQYAREKAVEDQIKFLGYRTPDEIQAILPECDIHIAPFIHLDSGQPDDVDGLARCILEAAATRIPTIGTDVGSTSDFVNDLNGRLIPQRHSLALAEAIKELANPVLRDALGNKAYEDVWNGFHYATAQKRLLPLIKQTKHQKRGTASTLGIFSSSSPDRVGTSATTSFHP